MFSPQLQLASLVLLCCVLFGVWQPSTAIRHDRHKTAHHEAKVGSHVVFNCYIDYPYEFPIPHVVHWSKDVSQLEKLLKNFKLGFFKELSVF